MPDQDFTGSIPREPPDVCSKISLDEDIIDEVRRFIDSLALQVALDRSLVIT